MLVEVKEFLPGIAIECRIIIFNCYFNRMAYLVVKVACS